MDRNLSLGGAPLKTAPADALHPSRNASTISKRRQRDWEIEFLDNGSYMSSISNSYPPVTPDRHARRNKKKDSFQFTLGASSSCSTNSLAFISQSSDSEMDDDDHAVSVNANATPMQFQFGNFNSSEQRKKSRTDVGYNGTFPNATTGSSMAMACKKNENTIEWWKKQKSPRSSTIASCSLSFFGSGPDRPRTTSSNSLTRSSTTQNAISNVCKCHVCQVEQHTLLTLPSVTTNTNINQTAMSVPQRSASSWSSSSSMSTFQHQLRPQHSERKPKNSLLSYFNPTKSSAHTASYARNTASSLNPHPDALHRASAEVLQSQLKSQSMPSCSYCDRSTCRSCMRICEACVGQYCTFCSMIDYEGPMERIFCFNCRNNSTDKDAMDMS